MARRGFRSDFLRLEGSRFGKWEVIGLARRSFVRGNAAYNALWLCRCDCGNMAQVQGHHLRNGKSTCCRACSIKRVTLYPPFCIVPGCGRIRGKGDGRGMCNTHYIRWRRGDRGDRLARPIGEYHHKDAFAATVEL